MGQIYRKTLWSCGQKQTNQEGKTSRIQKRKEDSKNDGKRINKREDKSVQKNNERKETRQKGKIDIREERKRKRNKLGLKKKQVNVKTVLF